MERVTVRLVVNDREHMVEVEPRKLLVDLLRELGYLSVHKGCDEGKCGACTVLLDGLAIKSCLIFAIQADGSMITTAEGLAREEELHPLQKAFTDNFAVQCGYCTSGMLMTAYNLLAREEEVNEEKVREAIVGNLCRCTGYVNIVKAILDAAERRKRGEWW
jgi:aerobic-type carbon monoxide dehydrogenase small subunit (CoxS/CutS family)